MENALTVKQNALKQWRNVRPMRSKPKFNRIRVDNEQIVEVDDEKTINKNFGSVYAISYDDNGLEVKEKIDIATAEFFPIRLRVQVKTKIMDGEKPMYQIKETEEFHNIHITKDNTEVYCGTYKDGKEKFQLQYASVVYVLYKDKVYRWQFGGSGVNWFDVKKELQMCDVPKTFMIHSVESVKTGTVEYNNVTFKVGNEFDAERAVEVITEFNKLFDVQVKTYVEDDQSDDKKITIEDVPF